MKILQYLQEDTSIPRLMSSFNKSFVVDIWLLFYNFLQWPSDGSTFTQFPQMFRLCRNQLVGFY